MKKIVRFWKNFFIMVWEVIKSMKSVRGILALLIAYMIFHGWAVFFFLFGLLTENPWLIATGTAAILFWFGPGTPLIPLILITAMFIQRYLLLDQSHKVDFKQKWKELNHKPSEIK
ncbi:MAG: hypothetical protein RBT45_00955 [Acholeplasmataceae bacterium]|jgi:hypothetical protein|nr:hypothetical protein [Acholeplasmataceae bacterium]